MELATRRHELADEAIFPVLHADSLESCNLKDLVQLGGHGRVIFVVRVGAQPGENASGFVHPSHLGKPTRGLGEEGEGSEEHHHEYELERERKSPIESVRLDISHTKR